MIILTLLVYWYFVATPFAVKSRFSFSKEQSIIVKDKMSIDLTLLNYLRTPITLENENITIADLIRLYVINKDKYKSKLDQETKKVLDNTFGDVNYKMEINNELFIENTAVGVRDDWIESSQYIPFQDSGIITIKFRMGEFGELNTFIG